MKNAIVPMQRIGKLRARIWKTDDPAELVKLAKAIDTMEQLLYDAGLSKQTEDVRPVNEARFEARWQLGQLLAKIERKQTAGLKRGPLSGARTTGTFRAYLREIGLGNTSANEAQRIGAIPEPKLRAFFAQQRKQETLSTMAGILAFGRQFWKHKNRQTRHRRIADEAEEAMHKGKFGPFPLIYADPAWMFETYGPGGRQKAADQHYPVMTPAEIMDFEIRGKPIEEIAADPAALFLWCTSSNLLTAIRVMQAWGFLYKTCAVWDKGQQGTGLIFRNMHELLLYGTRGEMPGPLYLPPSVFRYPRGKHSAKPPEIRREIERMFPDFDTNSRLELFARGHIEGWTTVGLEARQKEAAE